MGPVRVLVVDDSFFLRNALIKLLNSDDIIVVDTAKNGKEGIEKVLQHKPDVVTMDIEMPVMTGLQALEHIMKMHPIPVIMVSTLTSEGADATVNALTLGAVDFITKRAAFHEIDSIKDELRQKILAVGKNSGLKNQLLRKKLLQANLSMTNGEKVQSDLPKEQNLQKQSSIKRSRPKPSEIQAVGIGISTGGPAALLEMFRHFPDNFPVPILVVQHMPPMFTKSLSDRIDSISQLSVKEGEDGEPIKPGHVYIAPGGKQMTVNKKMRINISDEPKNTLFKPSVNVMVNSMVESFGKNSLAVIMTGMGNDGRDALVNLHNIHGYVLAQSADSCVVAGMPTSVIEANAADEVHSLNELSSEICKLLGVESIN